MLVGISVIAHVMIVIVYVSQEVIILRKDIRTAHIDNRQSYFFWIFYRIHILVFVRKTSSCFVPQIQTGVFVTNNLRRVFTVYGSVICGDYQLESELLRLLYDFQQG